MSRISKLPLALSLMAGAAALAACSETMADGDMSSASTTSTSTQTTTPAPSPTPTPTPSTGTSADASAEVMVGGAPMVATQTIVANAAKANNLTTLVKAVQAAGLADTLSGAGPFTVFAPTDQAFGLLPAGTVDSLMAPAAKQQLTTVLTHHVVSGRLDAAAIQSQIEAGGGTAQLSTVSGQPLTATIVNGNVQLRSTGGSVGFVEQADVPASNGVVHIINGVLVPRLNQGAAAPAQ
ncbi:fasciclin domain-containing protein [Sphingomonas sp. AX6]|uniref:fasciclin domain-containing protein n=1 Tax=Sphingomonas sp. AX6 TaxID=2653171 RepID=UPI0012F0DE05|nr:fasciclin domain-containing protein [Sphingomonas sp. AX6]VXD00699.1 conserved exported hypothetical protein [Sphingomonas sp. AX6]